MSKNSKNSVRVMTWNIYIGLAIQLLNETSPQDFKKNLKVLMEQLVTGNIYLRLQRIVEEIAHYHPDFIGLQEVSIWPEMPPYTKKANLITRLIQLLEKKGLCYRVVVQNQNTLIDHDVILGRISSRIRYQNVQGGHFDHLATANLGGFPVKSYRSWQSADILYDGKPFRLVNTHLEFISEQVRKQQAVELLRKANQTSLPTIILGDFNFQESQSKQAPYQLYIQSGYKDVWKAKRGKGGNTCCQDADLKNRRSKLDRRIDFIFIRGKFHIQHVGLVGNTCKKDILLRCWPSDHAGVVADLQF
ncbi:endonuclease/exonuclease/phosphatase family protein [Hazenella sp. IB182357]|uniref:Endonuclease/exonuclease/phosphatase family protein n=1 Tax=Polycladospora coralii TaxID=2771432 RepID=A0A926NE07_9BACL|nr:endonuclease/exonuclease/phosphatase family protein [Polycladospora coralii]MBD1371718.1 endonuclease/exonuclease/phosphatase family protein [Polycladospora coralii]MBS7529185.1 endonuclease/exonuclease/phosphatase family protein [Polycladospora coralii]